MRFVGGQRLLGGRDVSLEFAEVVVGIYLLK
jgi:hypothetical protein